MGRRRQSAAAADREMRSALRQHGMEVEAVNWVRARHDGEFACLVEPIYGGWANSKFVPRDIVNPAAASTLRFLLDMDPDDAIGLSKVLDITRIHVGQTAVRIYLKWAR